MLKEYRKISTIKAEQFDGSDEMIDKYGIVKENFVIDGWDPTFSIPTLEGDLAINIGDWIATGVEGEHWAIADDIFRKTYEEV